MTRFHIYDLQKQSEGIRFKEQLDLKTELMERNPEILELSQVFVQGQLRYDAGLYFLKYTASYTISMPSSRSMLPVFWDEELTVEELFVENGGETPADALLEDEFLLPLDGDEIVLEDSVADNILLHLPIQVLTPEEEKEGDMPHGKHWTVMTESQNEEQRKQQKASNNPFAQLQGLLDTE